MVLVQTATALKAATVFTLVAAWLSLAPPPGDGDLEMVPGPLNPWGEHLAGAEITVDGSGFPPGASLRFQFVGHAVALGTATVSSVGTFEVDLTLPADAAPGDAEATACRVGTGRICPILARAQLTIIAPPTTTTTTLPVLIETTTTTFGFGTPSTTLGGDPPPPPSTFPEGISTTTSLPGNLSGDEPGEIANLRLTEIEVTQGLQNLDNEFPLVESRRTFVRLFGVTDGAVEQTGVMGALEGVRDGESLGILFAENNPVHFRENIVRIGNDYSLYIQLPDSWAEGNLTLRGWVWANDPQALNEPEQSDNLIETNVSFDQARALHLYLYPLFMTEGFDPNGDPLIYQASEGWLVQALAVMRTLPVHFVQVHFPTTIVGDASSNWDLSKEGSPGAPLIALMELHDQMNMGDNHHFVGMVHPDLEPFMKFDGFGSSESAVWARMDPGFSQAAPWFQPGGFIIAHEMGHNMGISHAPCLSKFLDPIPGEAAGGATDPFFPQAYGWPDCSLAPTDQRGFYGFDVYWETTAMPEPAVMSNNPSVELPGVAFPFMGYRFPGWLDPWHGCQVLQFLEVACDQESLIPINDDVPGQGQGTPGTGSAHTPFNCALFEGPEGTDDFCNFLPNEPFDPIEAEEAQFDLLISGTVATGEDGSYLLTAVAHPVRQEPSAQLFGDGSRGGPFVVALVDAAGSALAVTSIEPEASGHGGDYTGSEPFVVRLPAVTGGVAIRLVTPDGVQAELRPGPGVPAIDSFNVAIGETDLGLTWTVSDPDGDDLAVLAQYRAGPDAEWLPLGSKLGDPPVAINIGSLPGGEAVEVRLLVSDGLHSAMSVAPPFAVADRTPQVLIFQPLNGQGRSAGRVMELVGQAWDPEDGILEDAAVSWHSDIDGDLGNGPAISAVLSEGTHLLTLRATDTAGNDNEAKTTIVIGPTNLPSEDVRQLIARAFSGEAMPETESTTTTATASTGDGGVNVWPLAVGGIAVGVVIGLLAERRRRS
jgi:hypothetical protein